MAPALIEVSVVCATARRQRSVTVRVPSGATIADAIAASGLAVEFPGLDLARLPVGVFSRQLPQDAAISDGDRIEIYRPLSASANERRQARVK